MRNARGAFVQLTFTPEVANALIEHAKTFRNSGLAQRVIPPEHTHFVEHIAQVWEQQPAKRECKHERDFFGHEIVPCDPKCLDQACVSYRTRLVTMFGADAIPSIYCTHCLECNLMAH